MTDIRVMIVDDVEKVRQDLCTILTLMGNIEIVGEAQNGREAIHQARILHPEVILMDLEMPFIDGYEATRQIKACLPSCRVIALTIHDYESTRLQAIEAGMDGFIVKGASLESLLRIIAEQKE
ncbi:MAG: response regulator [Anaerolineales bacterium]|nr:response regulator [Anaerolineales bacterium]